MCHRHVVGFGGQLIDQLVVANHRDQRCARRGELEAAVVETRAAAQPHAATVDGQCGNQDHGGSAYRVGRLPWRGGFEQAERGFYQLTRSISAPLQRQRSVLKAAARHREQDLDPVVGQRVDQRQRSGFGTHRDVGADRRAGWGQRACVLGEVVRFVLACLCTQRPAGSQDSAAYL